MKINSLIETAIDSLKQASNTNTVIGTPHELVGGTVIIPVCKLTLGFVAGGGDYAYKERRVKWFKSKKEKVEYGDELPLSLRANKGYEDNFAGGTGGGATLTPIGFLIFEKGKLKFIRVDDNDILCNAVNLTKEIIEKFKNRD